MKMQIWKIFVIHSIFLTGGVGYALEPNEILVIANSQVPASVRIAKYYCAKRRVPERNVLALPLGTSLSEAIDRGDVC
ncbi:MAG: hypothetical protein ACYSR6_12330 [Planctomycetota bacterium]